MSSDDEIKNDSRHGNGIWSDEATDALLNLVQACSTIDIKDMNSDIWDMIAVNMYRQNFVMVGKECKKKFESMVTHYHDLTGPADTTDFNLPLWPFYIQVKNIISQSNVPEQDYIPDTVGKIVIGQERITFKKEKESSMSDSESEHMIEDDQLPQSSMMHKIDSLIGTSNINNRLQYAEDLIDSTEIDQLQNGTNDFLKQILGQLTTLSDNLSNSRDAEAITLVLPES